MILDLQIATVAGGMPVSEWRMVRGVQRGRLPRTVRIAVWTRVSNLLMLIWVGFMTESR